MRRMRDDEGIVHRVEEWNWWLFKCKYRMDQINCRAQGVADEDVLVSCLWCLSGLRR